MSGSDDTGDSGYGQDPLSGPSPDDTLPFQTDVTEMIDEPSE